MTRMLASVADAAEAERRRATRRRHRRSERTRGRARSEPSRSKSRARPSPQSRGRSENERGARRSALRRRRFARSRASAGGDGRRLPQACRRCADARSSRRSLRKLARDVALVGMMFADEKPDFSLLAKLRELGFKGAVLDTSDKTRGRLLAHLEVVRLGRVLRAMPRAQPDERFGRVARSARHSATVAGAPRRARVQGRALSRPRPAGKNRPGGGGSHPRSHSARETGSGRVPQDRLAAAGSGSRRRARREGDLDRVFVRDFVVSASIGAYDFERSIRQRVVFDVEALVRRAGAHADDMRARSFLTTSYSTPSVLWSGVATSPSSRRSPRRSRRSFCSTRACAAFGSASGSST